jgi:hypothetical protein
MIPSDLERAVYGLVSTPVLHLADKHGVFTCLIEQGPSTSATIAGKLGIDEETLERLLIVLAAFGVVTRNAQGGYQLPDEIVPYLDKTDDRYVGMFVHHLVSSTAGRLDQLEAYLVRGKAAVDAGSPSPFEAFYRDEDSVRDFVQAMWHLSFAVCGELAPLAEQDTATRLVDVGGASGPFAVAALLRAPRLRAVVFDLPEVEPHFAATRREYGLGERLGFVSGDFFQTELPAGDRIALGYILSDWRDETCVELLRKAYRACHPGGTVLVMERLFDEDRSAPLATAVMNLSMHVETQGRHRTAEDYVGLIEAAGFAGCEVRRSSGDKHLVIGRKAGTPADS